MSTYRGFSTLNSPKKFRLTDFELAKRDLQNYFMIRKGEKLMNPDFGTIIWGMMFEPLNNENRQLMVNDIQRIVAYDPRLRVDNVQVNEVDNGLQIQVHLTYIPTNQVDLLNLNFSQNTQA
jgi:phage baseplate assembly protein W